jgi:hypothetical protein
MFKKYDNDTIFLMDTPAIIKSYKTNQKLQIIKEVEVSGIPENSVQIFMDYINKQIDAIDKARLEIRKNNPNFLPNI